jgi:hypothetical protein
MRTDLVENRPESRRVERVRRDLVVHAMRGLAHVCQPDTPLRQEPELDRREPSWCETALLEDRPEPVAGTGVVGARHGRCCAGGGAAEHDPQPGGE